ncbi:GerMN domain-containing protein [Proteiniborus sp. MB09-C3]|uniref:GerMN domain-containing protein n=1 Tax=Proteiniborus sp. MB09-C3 TaxID=3050072 RepID=UPI00255462FE|nr:GerMN domain-containing protein [Proteiniborus sp. MB09-C3]WIV11396.1 GerMN domain-containing protein [Proteiniborus sp. MB09-C3]
MKKGLVFFLVLAIAVFSLFGCSKNKDNGEGDIISADSNNDQTGKEVEKENNDTSSDKVKYIDFAVYLKHKDLPYIFGERFEIKSDDPILKEKTIEEIALEKLFTYNKESFVSPVPKNTKVLELEKKDGTVYLDLSKEFVDNMPKEEDLIRMAIDSIVNTITFFPENEKVVFKVGGESIKEINGVSLEKEFVFSSEFIPEK